ncbi:MAG: hypothetical protein H6713_18615 [Myxococcales bacterium]|nr:hypothetical protein [Myxococcales bacterium]
MSGVLAGALLVFAGCGDDATGTSGTGNETESTGTTGGATLATTGATTAGTTAGPPTSGGTMDGTGTTESVMTGPGTTGPGTTGPGTTETTDPGTTDPGTTDPGTTDPGTSSGTTDVGTTGPAPTCDDLEMNGLETDVDCGGPECDPCADGLMCLVGGDCESQLCDAELCVSCGDGLMNGAETDVDCGGPDCAPCELGEMCLEDGDCESQLCEGELCVAENQCVNGKGCLVVVSASNNQAYIYEPENLTLIDSYPGLNFPQSVAAGPNGLLYVGQSSEIRTIDILDKSTATIGGGLVSGFLYGMTVTDDRVYASGSGMPTVRVLDLGGGDQGTITSPNGSNLRSTAFGPGGDFYLTSFGGGPAQHWDPGIVYDAAFGGGGLSSAFGVGARSNGDVVITSQNNASYYVFTADGVYLKSVAVSCAGQVRNLAINGEDFAYVGCYGSNKVVVYNAADAVVDEVAVSSPSGVDILPAWPSP